MAHKVLAKGNEALAEAAIAAGCRGFFGYPITPQTDVAAYMARRMPQVGGVYVQAESEISAINMVMGAAAAGVRALTSSSSPGISLKAETISYLAACDLPAVIINMQRAGPGLGGIQPSQADYFQATKGLAHGDFHLIVLAPYSVQELADFMALAFELADRYRTPVILLGDGMLGQMMEPVVFPPSVESLPEKSWAATGTKGKRPPNIINSLYIQPDELEALVLERFKRYETMKQQEARFEAFLADDAEILITAYGSTARIAKSAVLTCREQGVRVGLFRPITLWPFPDTALKQAAQSANAILCVEMSMGQMLEDVRLALNGAKPVHFLGRTGGMIPTPTEIIETVLRLREGS